MRRTILSAILLIFLQAACVPIAVTSPVGPTPVRTQQPTLSPEQAVRARQSLVAWFECEECVNGELEAVVELGALAVPNLIAALHEGPSPASHEQYRRKLITTYRQLKEYEETHSEAKVSISEESYIETYLDSYIALYQIRAATALAAIGGSDAKVALEQALQLPLRDEVRVVVKNSLEKLTEP